MKLVIPRDLLDNPTPPSVYLCDTHKTILGELKVYDLHGDFKWNSYSEIRFSISRTYTDIITGETVVDPLFDKVEGLRNIYVKGIGYFAIQDDDTVYVDKDQKTVICFSLEYSSCGSKYLDNFFINTGEEGSVEVTYAANQYGDITRIEDMYKLAYKNLYNPSERYFHRVYTDSRNYHYEMIQIDDQNDYLTHFGEDIHSEDVLYIHGWAPVTFYDPHTPELSFLHCVFQKIPEWKIGHVDVSLRTKERRFNEERITVYDLLMNKVQDTFRCVVEWDTIYNEVNFYEEAEDGVMDNNEIQTRFDTDVFVSRENLASEINVRYSTDNIKTKLKVSGADNLDIREINLGSNYVMNLDFFHTKDWMGDDLYEAYNNYLIESEGYSESYKAASQDRVKAYNEWNKLMNAVPAEGGVIRIGDKFEKLYCIYAYNGADLHKSEQYKKLKDKLILYHVDQDHDAIKSDNVLLQLQDEQGNRAIIRVFRPISSFVDKDVYLPDCVFIIKITMISVDGFEYEYRDYQLSYWMGGDLTDSFLELNDYTVTDIGPLGAYLVTAKDETVEMNLEDYGVMLLKEKRDTYANIFVTQTELMFQKDNYQCVVSSEEPKNVNFGTRWLDTSSNPTVLKRWTGVPPNPYYWEIINQNVHPLDRQGFEDYQRYLDNFDKLIAVQTVLSKKEKEAQYMSDGYVVPNSRITTPSQSLMKSVAEKYFGKEVTEINYDGNIYLYFFNVDDKDYAVYLKGTTPYIAYADSIAVHRTRMNYYAEQSRLENFFTEDQWIRLSPLIREDEFTDDNFLLTGYESEEERLEIYQELKEAAEKELKTLSKPSLEFSMNLANILALPEFRPLINQFQLGNFVRVYIRDNLVKRARLLEVRVSFNNLSDFNAEFGNLITTKSEIDKHAELLKQAVQAGKQVAQSSSSWQKAVDKVSKLEEEINNGLQNVTLEVGKVYGQSIEIGKYGIRGRKLVDGTTDQYEDEQFAMINNKLVFTGDNWRTSKAAFGKFTVNGEERWGVLGDAIVGGYIEGSILKGGSLEIGGQEGDGGKFIVNRDGSVEILSSDFKTPVYATKNDMTVIQDARRFYTSLEYSGSTIFSEPNSSCTITCRVYSWDTDITNEVMSNGATFSWIRASTKNDTDWNTAHKNMGSNVITITNADIESNAQFSCEVIFDDTKIK